MTDNGLYALFNLWRRLGAAFSASRFEELIGSQLTFVRQQCEPSVSEKVPVASWLLVQTGIKHSCSKVT